MIIIGVDYHPSFQQIAFVDKETGEYGEQQLNHSDGEAEKFYRDLKLRGGSVRVGMEATGHARWFERLLAELGFELWIGDPAEIKTKRVRKQKTDRQDAQLMLKLLLEDRFPRVWVPSSENRDLRQLLWHRHRLVQMRTRIMNQLQAVAMNEGVRRKKKLWNKAGRAQLESFLLAPWATRRRRDLLELMARLNPSIEQLSAAIELEAEKRPEVKRLMTHPGDGQQWIRNKTIGQRSLLGQQGINLIEKIVLEMGFAWHPTNQSLEVGLDGFIEIRDPTTGEAFNTVIFVQSKATEGEFTAETSIVLRVRLR